MLQGESGPDRGEQRSVVYCLVPHDLAAQLHEPLRAFFRNDVRVEVVVEQRRSERRGGGDRRADLPAGDALPAEERRRIRSEAGRRVGDRRAVAISVEPPMLPRRVRRYAERLAFVERFESADAGAADLEATRIALRAQAGDKGAFAELYIRYFDRVYRYMRVALRNSHDAEDATQQVFVGVIGALDRYEPRRPFGAWLFTIARNNAVNRLRRSGRLEVTDPEVLERRSNGEEESSAEADLASLDWISDRDLSLFVERLPEAQRQVLVLRYVLGFDTAEIAQILERSTDDIRKLQSRAHGFLRDRLTKVRGDAPRTARRSRMRIRPRQATVLRARRFSLH